jgi:hypothetical protein
MIAVAKSTSAPPQAAEAAPQRAIQSGERKRFSLRPQARLADAN